MTYLEYVLMRNPSFDAGMILRNRCPSKFGLDDPARCDMTCVDCWNRQISFVAAPCAFTEIQTVLDPGAVLPTRGHDADAGLDLYSRDEALIEPGGCHVFDTGVHMAIPRGFAGVLIAKSGLNVKFDCTSTGLIDADYTGSIAVKLYNHGNKTLHIAARQKISRLVLVPIITPKPVQVDSLVKTERGSSGFGSTGAF